MISLVCTIGVAIFVVNVGSSIAALKATADVFAVIAEE